MAAYATGPKCVCNTVFLWLQNNQCFITYCKYCFQVIYNEYIQLLSQNFTEQARGYRLTLSFRLEMKLEEMVKRGSSGNFRKRKQKRIPQLRFCVDDTSRKHFIHQGGEGLSLCKLLQIKGQTLKNWIVREKDLNSPLVIGRSRSPWLPLSFIAELLLFCSTPLLFHLSTLH